MLTGDNVQEEGLASYVQLRQLVEARARSGECRLGIIPGNHDPRRHIMQAFPEQFDSTGVGALPATFAEQAQAQAGDASTARATFAEVIGGWLVVGLDTLDDGQQRARRGEEVAPSGAGNGGFDSEQAAWLRRTLSAHPTTPAVIFLHHPPIASVREFGAPADGPTPFDPIFEPAGLAALQAVVADHQEQVKMVCAGHFHADFATSIGGVPLVGTPASYAVQFDVATAGALGSTDEGALPGYRVLELGAEGKVETRVVRVPLPTAASL